MLQCNKAGMWQTYSEGTVTVLHTTPTTHIADSSPALECPSNASSRYTALERAISSFSLRLTLVTNDSRVTEASSHSSSTAPFPEASILEPYGHKNFTIVINSLDTSFTANNSRWQQAYKLANYGDRE